MIPVSYTHLDVYKRQIEDITKLPFTVKQDLRDNYPFGLMAVPMSEIVRLHASSGTTGKPIVVGYTRKDLSIWSEVVARCLTAYGLSLIHIYPDWSIVNPKLKREEDATALESLRWLIREARAYNTTISLHINMVDAFEESPLWDTYIKNDIIARDVNGNLKSIWEYAVSYTHLDVYKRQGER